MHQYVRRTPARRASAPALINALDAISHRGRRAMRAAGSAALFAIAAPATLEAQADLVLNVTDAPDPVPATGLVTYSVVVENNGLGTANGVSYVMNVPAGARYAGFTAGTGAACSGMTINQLGPGVVTCTHPSLAFTASGSFTVLLRPQSQGTLTVNSTVSTTDFDTDPSNNSVQNTTTVIAGADVAVTLTAPATLASGTTTGWGITVSNAGPDPATALRSTPRQSAATSPGRSTSAAR
ncbi:MAG: DUF11 domain-containing protein [Gemmatimonadaceae bacterium]|nr:DUF11 domain-containing protein [Gemmatimonadaceae bacterium]